MFDELQALGPAAPTALPVVHACLGPLLSCPDGFVYIGYRVERLTRHDAQPPAVLRDFIDGCQAAQSRDEFAPQEAPPEASSRLARELAALNLGATAPAFHLLADLMDRLRPVVDARLEVIATKDVLLRGDGEIVLADPVYTMSSGQTR